MYCRVASQVDPLPLWQWKSPALSELSALFQWFRLYHALLAACTVMLIVLWILYQCHTFTWLGQHGKPVTALVTQVGPAKPHVIGGHAFVTAKWTDPRTGRAYTFEGLSAALPLSEGALVTVQIDPH